MPWMPEFVSAVELARLEARDAGRADPVTAYVRALSDGDPGELEDVWPGEVVVDDPRAGTVRGHRDVRRFVRRNLSWLSDRHARIERVAETRSGDRAVVELTATLLGPPGGTDGTDGTDGRDGTGDVGWPVAVVAESPDDRSVRFRTYCSQLPVDGRRHLRPPILDPDDVTPPDVVGRHLAALRAGDRDAVVDTFAPDGYLREAIGSHRVHRGHAELRAFFTRWLGDGGGIELEYCAATDDGVRCALEVNWRRWGGRELPRQAGLAVHERGAGGLLAAVRLYDDVIPPG